MERQNVRIYIEKAMILGQQRILGKRGIRLDC